MKGNPTKQVFFSKKAKEVWEELRRTIGSTVISKCINKQSKLCDVVENFDIKNQAVLDNYESHTNSFHMSLV